jgi:hypothetical protein
LSKKITMSKEELVNRNYEKGFTSGGQTIVRFLQTFFTFIFAD